MSAEATISIVLPTRRRVELINRLFESIVATADRADRLEVVLYLDSDDKPSHAIEHPDLKVIKLIDRPAKMGVMARRCYEASTGEYILQLNDDVVCRTPGWDTAMVEAFRQFPDEIALIWCNPASRSDKMPTFPMVSRRTCQLMGSICPADYNRDHIDTHLFDIFVKLHRLGHDRLVYLKDVVVEHLHFLEGKAKFDATYEKPRQFADELVFIAWDEQRRIIAESLARHIEREASCAS